MDLCFNCRTGSSVFFGSNFGGIKADFAASVVDDSMDRSFAISRTNSG